MATKRPQLADLIDKSMEGRDFPGKPEPVQQEPGAWPGLPEGRKAGKPEPLKNTIPKQSILAPAVLTFGEGRA